MSSLTEKVEQSISKMVGDALLDTKYPKEPISFGQAAVIYHYMAAQQKSYAELQQQSMSLEQQSSLDTKKQVIQFELSHQPEICFKRQKVIPNEGKNVAEALQWEGDDLGFTKRKMKEIQRSPSKWQTEQRDLYRFYVEDEKEKEEVDEGDQNKDKDNDEWTTQNGEGKRTNSDEGSQLPEKTDYKQCLQPTSDKAQIRRNIAKRKKDQDSTTRWLADSAFQTFYGKPAFHAYGKGNVNPTVGGTVYGHYMLSHNVNPACGDHPPVAQQVYDDALTKGSKKGYRKQKLPRGVVEEHRLSKAQVQELKNRNPIMPKEDKRYAEAAKKMKIVDRTQSQINQSSMNLKAAKKQSKKVTHESQSTLPKDEEGDYENVAPNEIDAKEYVVEQQSVQSDKQTKQMQNVEDFKAAYGDNQYNEGDQEDDHQHPAQMMPMCQIPTPHGAVLNELNPRHYAYLPVCWTNRIRPAGRVTYQSEPIFNLLTGAPNEIPFQEST